jgi:Family of unknown function (DUF6082)
MTTQGSEPQRGVVAAIALGIAATVGVITLVAALSLAIGAVMHELSPDTDVSPANAVFSGLAFGAVVIALAVQHRQLHRQNTNLSIQLKHMAEANGFHERSALTNQHRLQFELLSKAMEDPDLVTVLDTYELEVPLVKQRQYLFANAVYNNVLHAYQIGSTNETEVYGHLRVICQNAIFREYWELTRHHRASLRYESREGQLGRVVDGILARQRLDRANWWTDPP